MKKTLRPEHFLVVRDAMKAVAPRSTVVANIAKRTPFMSDLVWMQSTNEFGGTQGDGFVLGDVRKQNSIEVLRRLHDMVPHAAFRVHDHGGVLVEFADGAQLHFSIGEVGHADDDINSEPLEHKRQSIRLAKGVNMYLYESSRDDVTRHAAQMAHDWADDYNKRYWHLQELPPLFYWMTLIDEARKNNNSQIAHFLALSVWQKALPRCDGEHLWNPAMPTEDLNTLGSVHALSAGSRPLSSAKTRREVAKNRVMRNGRITLKEGTEECVGDANIAEGIDLGVCGWLANTLFSRKGQK